MADAQPTEKPAGEDPQPDSKPVVEESGPQRSSNALHRVFSGAYTSLAIVGFCLFFMPWLKLSCIDVTIVSQSGYELATGKLKEEKDWESKLQAAMAKESSQGGETPQQDMRSSQAKSDLKKGTSKFLLLLLFPVGLGLAAGFGLIGVLANRPVPILPAMIGGVLAALAVIGSVATDFPLEKEFYSSKAEKKVFLQMFDLERTPVYTAAMAVGGIVPGLIALHWLIQLSTGRAAPNTDPGKSADGEPSG